MTNKMQRHKCLGAHFTASVGLSSTRDHAWVTGTPSLPRLSSGLYATCTAPKNVAEDGIDFVKDLNPFD